MIGNRRMTYDKVMIGSQQHDILDQTIIGHDGRKCSCTVESKLFLKLPSLSL